MVLDQPLLGPTPKSLQAVDVDLAGGEVLLVVHLQVPIAAEHEAVVALELVRIDDRIPADLLGRPLQSASVTLATAPEVAFIQFDLSAQQKGDTLGLNDNGQPDALNGPGNRPVSQTHLLGPLTDGDLQFKELDRDSHCI